MGEPQIIGCLLGTAVGDALGLPYEGVSRFRAPRLLGPPDRHRFLGRHGMVSDDTEHTCLVAQALIATGDDVDAFQVDFARRLRRWFLLLPAGIGRATLRASLKLCCGVPPSSSGVWSAGNGPSMRSSILGATLGAPDRIVEYVRASARITHRDPKAERGAIAVALAAFMARSNSTVNPADYVDRLADLVDPHQDELLPLVRHAARSVEEGQSTLQFAEALGLERGVTGYTLHTVPVTLQAWLSNQRDYRNAVMSVIACGGDADTTAAIVGGIVGTAVGERGIPPEWLNSIREFPMSVEWMRQLGTQLEKSRVDAVPTPPIRCSALATLSRNLLFLLIVLFHGFRRCLPPF